MFLLDMLENGKILEYNVEWDSINGVTNEKYWKC